MFPYGGHSLNTASCCLSDSVLVLNTGRALETLFYLSSLVFDFTDFPEGVPSLKGLDLNGEPFIGEFLFGTRFLCFWYAP